MTKTMRLRVRILGASLGMSQRLRRLNRWLAEPIVHRDVEVPPPHRCVFESRMRSAGRLLLNCALALAIGILLAIAICPGAVLR